MTKNGKIDQIGGEKKNGNVNFNQRYKAVLYI